MKMTSLWKYLFLELVRVFLHAIPRSHMHLCLPNELVSPKSLSADEKEYEGKVSKQLTKANVFDLSARLVEEE